MSSPARSARSITPSTTSPPVKNQIDFELTPRSKIKALLEQYNSSDSESGGPPKIRSPVKRTTVLPESDEDEEDDRPRGKLASRLKAAGQPNQDDDDVVSRVRKSIFGQKVQVPVHAAQELVDNDVDMDSEDEIVSTRRRRPAKRSSPARTASSSHSPSPSNSIFGSSSPVRSPEEEDTTNKLEAEHDTSKAGKGALMLLVEKKRKEALAKEEKERAAREARAAVAAETSAMRAEAREAEEMSGGSEEDEIDDQLTQSTLRRPKQRKASKKALLEMEAAQQKIKRDQQLAHKAIVLKKYTVDGLLERLKLKSSPMPPILTDAPKAEPSPVPLWSNEDSHTTPATSVHSSPMEQTADVQPVEEITNPFIMDDDEDIPDLEHFVAEAEAKVEAEKSASKGKGKGRALPEPEAKGPIFTVPTPKFYPQIPADDSDSDGLEIVKPNIDFKNAKKHVAPTKSDQPKALRDLRALARLHSPSKKPKNRRGKVEAPNMTTKQLMMDLQQRSRRQIKQAQEEEKEQLRLQGKYVPTDAERAKENEAVEDLVEKERLKDLALKKLERKQEAREKGVRLADLTDDDEDDDDWLGSEDDEEEIELSGSEDEDGNPDGLIDEEAGEDEDTTVDGEAEDADMEPPPAQPFATPRLSDMPEILDEDDTEDSVVTNRRSRRAIVDDDDEITHVPSSLATPANPVPFRDLTSAALPMGLTQMFNASLEPAVVEPSLKPLAALDAQSAPMGLTQMFEASLEPGAESRPLAALNAQSAPMGLTQMFEASMGSITARDSTEQLQAVMPASPEDLAVSQIPDDTETQGIDLHYSQSQIMYEPESMLPDMSFQCQIDAFPDPTPDQGFTHSSQPLPPRFESEALEIDTVADSQKATNETVKTVLISPPRKKGKLVRRQAVEEEDEESAFDIIKKKARAQAGKEKESLNRKEARELFEDAAEESDDEYAGLGGGGDEDEDEDENTSEFEDMIDNNNERDAEEVERELAGLYAQKSREEDKRQVDKIFHDLNNGNLRKKRGTGFDLDSDSDDEERRIRARQRMAQRKRDALLKDSNLSQIATNTKAQQFLAAIDGEEEGGSFLDQDEEEPFDFAVGVVESTQEPEDMQVDTQTQLHTNKRRTASKKARSRLDVQRTVSSLLDDRNTMVELDSSSEEEDDSQSKRRKTAHTIIDRVAVKRSNTATSETTKLAFHAPTDPTGQFRVPSLLRRATTQMTEYSATTTSVTTERQTDNSTGIKRGGKASSSINFHQREAVRKERIVGKKGMIEQERKMVVTERRKGVAGIFNAGGFE